MSEHYDVIIIGSGAGGGTLAYRLAPTGARILLLERGEYVRREKENWSSEAVNVLGRYATKESWTDSDGKPLHPHTNYYVGGNTKFATTAGCHPPGRSATTRWSRTTPRRSGCITCTATAARTRRNRSRAARIRIPPSATSRASST
jgi:choline dehydrogenase-like flavoprotein